MHASLNMVEHRQFRGKNPLISKQHPCLNTTDVNELNFLYKNLTNISVDDLFLVIRFCYHLPPVDKKW